MQKYIKRYDGVVMRVSEDHVLDRAIESWYTHPTHHTIDKHERKRLKKEAKEKADEAFGRTDRFKIDYPKLPQ